jgi:hypothetical protein
MSEYHRETEFLRQCILYDESAVRQELEAQVTHNQRNLRCVQRAAWLMAPLTALAAVFLYYPAILLQNFPDSAPNFIVNLVCALGLGSLISLLGFLGLGIVYRKRLDLRREECRRMVTRLLESRLGKSVTAPLLDRTESNIGTLNDKNAQLSGEANGFPVSQPLRPG